MVPGKSTQEDGMLNARFTTVIAASFTALVLSHTVSDAAAQSIRFAGPGQIQIAQNNPADIISQLKSKLSSAKKNAGTQLKTAKKFKSLAGKKRTSAQRRKDIANAQKAEKAIRSQQSTVAKLKRQLGKFKSARLPGPIKTKFKAASKSRTSAEKTLKQARTQLKSALAALQKSMKAQATAAKRFAGTKRSKATTKKSAKLLSEVKSTIVRMKTKPTSKSRAALSKLKSSQRSQVASIGKLIAAGKSGTARGKMQSLIKSMTKGQAKSTDIGGLVSAIMRESYVEQQKNLRVYADKVKKLNALKDDSRKQLKGPHSEISINALEKELATIGDDAQLANIELQNALQKQQQTLQTMSNISKMLHDTAMAIIRKIG